MIFVWMMIADSSGPLNVLVEWLDEVVVFPAKK
jgi:hypothetical protein